MPCNSGPLSLWAMTPMATIANMGTTRTDVMSNVKLAKIGIIQTYGTRESTYTNRQAIDRQVRHAKSIPTLDPHSSGDIEHRNDSSLTAFLQHKMPLLR